MSQGTTNPKHNIFIREMIKHGNKKRAYKAAYPSITDESARTASTRLMKEEYIREALKNAHLNITVGIREDKEAFIHQELNLLNLERQMLLIAINDAAVELKERIKAIQADRALAAEQAKLLGYVGEEHVVQNVTEKNAETVTSGNMDEEDDVLHFPLQPATGSSFPPFTHYENEIHPVTNRNSILCKTG
jgi:hypothetical protein